MLSPLVGDFYGVSVIGWLLCAIAEAVGKSQKKLLEAEVGTL